MPGSGGSDHNAKLLATLAEPFINLELSVRVANILEKKFGKDSTLRQVVGMTEDQWFKTENVGKVSFNELKEVLAHRGLHLEMEIPPEVEVKSKPNHELELVEGMDQAQLSKWIIDAIAGDVEHLRFKVEGGFLDIPVFMQHEYRRSIAESARAGRTFTLTFASVGLVLTFDPKTQKGSLRFVF